MEVPTENLTNIESIIHESARLAALECAREVLAEQAKSAAGRSDRRLHNTKLLLKNYRMFKAYCTGAVYTDENGEHDGQDDETALEIMDMMLQRDTYSVTVESIRKSCRRTKIMVQHIDSMLDMYRVVCEQSSNAALLRGYRIIKGLYLDDPPSTAEQLVLQENICLRQLYRDANIAIEKISLLMFGIDGLDFI